MDLESVTLREESVGGQTFPPPIELRLPADLTAATTEGLYVLYDLNRGVRIAHVHRHGARRHSSVTTFNGTLPARTEARGHGPFDILILEIGAARLSALRRNKQIASGLHFIADASSSPLAACMRHLAERMHTASQQEIAALHEACVFLLVPAERHLERVVQQKVGAAPDKPLLRGILAYTDRNICDPTLAPAAVAAKFGISVRYLHKLFADSGVTFGAYVVALRLDHVRSALTSGAASKRTIANLAQEWGFRDVSAFNKAFRKRFGCAPRRLRSRVAT